MVGKWAYIYNIRLAGYDIVLCNSKPYLMFHLQEIFLFTKKGITYRDCLYSI